MYPSRRGRRACRACACAGRPIRTPSCTVGWPKAVSRTPSSGSTARRAAHTAERAVFLLDVNCLSRCSTSGTLTMRRRWHSFRARRPTAGRPARSPRTASFASWATPTIGRGRAPQKAHARCSRRFARPPPRHQFWPDAVTLRETRRLTTLPASGQLTDAYLLMLAAERRGRLATFDRRIDPAWVVGGSRALLILSTSETA